MGNIGKLAGSACRLMRLGRAAETRGDGLSRRAVLLLQDAIDPAVVSERETRDGRLIQYIEGWAAISQANRIFGDEAKAHAWALKHYGGPLDSLDADQLADAVRFLADRLNQRNGAKASHDGGSAKAA